MDTTEVESRRINKYNWKGMKSCLQFVIFALLTRQDVGSTEWWSNDRARIKDAYVVQCSVLWPLVRDVKTEIKPNSSEFLWNWNRVFCFICDSLFFLPRLMINWGRALNGGKVRNAAKWKGWRWSELKGYILKSHPLKWRKIGVNPCQAGTSMLEGFFALNQDKLRPETVGEETFHQRGKKVGKYLWREAKLDN